MIILGWVIVIILFIVGFVGVFFPIIPGVFAIYLAFFIYGTFFSFAKLGFWFWAFETTFLGVIIVADYLIPALGIQKTGGSKKAIWGAVIGLTIGPFLLPILGLILGPFVGAYIGQLMEHKNESNLLDIALSAAVSVLTSSIVKIVVQVLMVVVFFLYVFFG